MTTKQVWYSSATRRRVDTGAVTHDDPTQANPINLATDYYDGPDGSASWYEGVTRITPVGTASARVGRYTVVEIEYERQVYRPAWAGWKN